MSIHILHISKWSFQYIINCCASRKSIKNWTLVFVRVHRSSLPARPSVGCIFPKHCICDAYIHPTFLFTQRGPRFLSHLYPIFIVCKDLLNFISSCSLESAPLNEQFIKAKTSGLNQIQELAAFLVQNRSYLYGF